jgi:hypothetical protein
MKNILFILIIVILFFSNCSKKITQNKLDCHENASFKKMFFSNIDNIEKNVLTNQGDSFRNSLKVIYKYVHVSFESMLNYNNSYPYAVFKEDKENWLKWYELNKCNDLKVIK